MAYLSGLRGVVTGQLVIGQTTRHAVGLRQNVFVFQNMMNLFYFTCSQCVKVYIWIIESQMVHYIIKIM